MKETYILKVYRGEPGNQYWEEFECTLKPGVNIISSLMEIQRNPVTKEGKRVSPVVWESGCLEEVCGSCSMLINSIPRQACSALVEVILQETKEECIAIAPLSKFPLVRDLVVDRTQMFENLKKVSAWIEVDDSRSSGPGPKISQEKQELMYALSKCMTCGCCSEGCPQVNNHSRFIGPAAIAQARLFNTHPVGSFEKPKRLRALMEDGGVSDCGNAQNCVRVCPKKLPLTEAISAIGRDVTKQAIQDIFGLPA